MPRPFSTSSSSISLISRYWTNKSWTKWMMRMTFSEWASKSQERRRIYPISAISTIASSSLPHQSAWRASLGLKETLKDRILSFPQWKSCTSTERVCCLCKIGPIWLKFSKIWTTCLNMRVWRTLLTPLGKLSLSWREEFTDKTSSFQNSTSPSSMPWKSLISIISKEA